jgi:hypothetical protein
MNPELVKFHLPTTDQFSVAVDRYRWLREAYVAYRRGGKCIAETEAVMGLASAKSIAWEAEVAAAPVGITFASPSIRRLGSGRSMTPAAAPMPPPPRLGLAGRPGIGG